MPNVRASITEVGVILSLHIICGLALGYVLSSVLESLWHNNIQHARGRVLRFLQRHPKLCRALLSARFSHQTVHHAWTYRKDHVTQFRSVEEQQALDTRLSGSLGTRIRRERYGTTLKGFGVLAFLAPSLPFFALVPVLFGPWVALGAAISMLLSPWMSAVVHPLLHMRHNDAIAKAGPLLRWLLRTRYMKAVARHHWMHHRNGRINFNLVLLGDYLLGVHRRPTQRDIEEMSRVGIPVDDLRVSRK
jgi:hypothetical protein